MNGKWRKIHPRGKLELITIKLFTKFGRLTVKNSNYEESQQK